MPKKGVNQSFAKKFGFEMFDMSLMEVNCQLYWNHKVKRQRIRKVWKTEYHARTSVERSDKREKLDFLLEKGLFQKETFLWQSLKHGKVMEKFPSFNRCSTW